MKEALVSQFANFLAYVASTGIRNCKFISTWDHRFLLRDHLLYIAQTQAGSVHSLRKVAFVFGRVFTFWRVFTFYKSFYILVLEETGLDTSERRI